MSLKEEKNIDLLFREGLKNHEEGFSASIWDNIANDLDTNTETSSIDKLFKNGLENHEAQIPASLWANIESGLDEKVTTSPIDSLFKNGLENHEEAVPPFVWNNVADGIKTNSKKKRLYIIRAIAASIAILLSFTTGLLLTDYGNNNITALNDTENSVDLIEIQNNDISISIQELVNNVKKKKPRKTLYADANLSASDFNENADYFTVIPAKELDFNVINSDSEIIEDEKLKSLLNSNNKAQNKTEISKVIVSSVMHQKTYAATANYNKNFEIKKKKDQSGWIVGGYFSPVFSFRSAQTNESYSQPRRASADNVTKEIQTKDFYDEKEQGAYSFASGVNIEYKTKNRWALQSGIYITSLGQVTDNISQELVINAQQQNYIMTTSAGSISINDNFADWEVATIQTVKEIPETVELLQDFEYLEIPMNVRFNVLDDNSRVSLDIIGGISTNVLLKNRAFLQDDNQKYEIGETNNINKFIYNSNIGLGVAYRFTEKISMNIEPSFKYSLVPLNKNYPIYYRPYYFNLFTGISYKF